LALKNKKEAIAINDKKRLNGDTNLDPRERITSIDLAGDEANYPVDVFRDVFQKIHRFNKKMLDANLLQHCLGITIHAGEEPFSSDASKRNYQWSQSIEKAYDVGYWGPTPSDPTAPLITPFRIGHGIMLWAAESEGGLLRREYAAYAQNPRAWADAVGKDKKRIQAIIKATPLIQKLLAGNVGIELCPKSNVQTGSVPYYTVHPALFFLTLGLKVSVNTDNRTISNTDNANELIKLHRYLGLRWEELKTLIRNGAETAFIPTKEERDQVKADIEARLTELERDPKKLLGIMLMDGYTPPAYVYKTPGKISPIASQNAGLYPRIDAGVYRDTASRAENQRTSAVFDVIKEQTAALKSDKPQPWEANA
jgi:adenosine deaminase